MKREFAIAARRKTCDMFLRSRLMTEWAPYTATLSTLLKNYLTRKNNCSLPTRRPSKEIFHFQDLISKSCHLHNIVSYKSNPSIENNNEVFNNYYYKWDRFHIPSRTHLLASTSRKECMIRHKLSRIALQRIQRTNIFFLQFFTDILDYEYERMMSMLTSFVWFACVGIGMHLQARIVVRCLNWTVIALAIHCCWHYKFSPLAKPICEIHIGNIVISMFS